MPTCAREVENKAVNNLISANRKEFNSRLFSSVSPANANRVDRRLL